MARFLLICSIPAIFALSFFFGFEKGVYPVLFNFSVLPLGILSYTGTVLAWITGAFLCFLVILWYVFFMGVEVTAVLPAIFVFGITPLAFTMLKKAYENERGLALEATRESQKFVKALREKEARLDKKLKGFDEHVSEIVGLYEITKAMSATLLFSEIFHIFTDFLNRNFSFTACRLILLNNAGDIEKVYKIETPPGKDEPARPEVTRVKELIDSEILIEIRNKKKVISWEDFIAIPLVSHQKVIGILNVEGLGETAFEKFLIVARQFSLEIEKVRLYETVQEFAIMDGLTGIFVRRYFIEMFKDEFGRSAQHNFKLSYLMVDLDHFKGCNDTFGHLVGDVVLKEAARILKHNIREIDFAGRYGGEEFALVLPETDTESALLVAERLRELIEQNVFKAYEENVKMTISIGIATFPDHAGAFEELMECGDRALYQAKAEGRNRVVVFEKRR